MSTACDIVIFSPHLDDAVLGVFDHIQQWKGEGQSVEVVTIFTSFGKGKISSDARKQSGIRKMSPEEFERQRINEDKAAMKMLAVNWKHLGFVDGGFRVFDNKLTYPTFDSLFSGHIAKSDEEIIGQLARVMRRYSKVSTVVIPLGVGKHADHVIARTAAEKVFSKHSLYYYVDFPYALSMRKWSISHLVQYVRSKKSKKRFSGIKLSVLRCYKTQAPLLFRSTPSYSEILIHER
jgi:LmbE family N-acetylglucosaminyl deacetylase